MDLGLTDRVALVAGSSSGLGYATAHELAREGARVVLNGRDEGRLKEARERLLAELSNRDEVRSRVATVAADVASPEGCASLVEGALERFGSLDILVTNAGGPPTGRFDELDEAQWSQAFELTLMSAVRLIRAALPALRASEAASIPLGRMAEPAEIGRVAAFLCSPASSYVNGVMLQVDGGSYPGLL